MVQNLRNSDSVNEFPQYPQYLFTKPPGIRSYVLRYDRHLAGGGGRALLLSVCLSYDEGKYLLYPFPPFAASLKKKKRIQVWRKHGALPYLVFSRKVKKKVR